MIKEVNRACEKLNDTLGIYCLLLGGISAVSGVILRKESKNKIHES